LLAEEVMAVGSAVAGSAEAAGSAVGMEEVTAAVGMEEVTAAAGAPEATVEEALNRW
jgi:hypothetical protein